MHKVQPKICKTCNEGFTPKSGRQLFCGKCVKDARLERRRKSEQKRRLANPERYKVIDKVHQLKRRSAGAITLKQYRELLGQAKECFYCGSESERYEIDHYIPISKGGTSDLNNLVVACQKCNREKWNKHPLEFLGGMSKIIDNYQQK